MPPLKTAGGGGEALASAGRVRLIRAASAWYVSNPDVEGYPLEEIGVPMLIVNARDDGLWAFQNAVRAADRTLARSCWRSGRAATCAGRPGPARPWHR